MSNINWNETYTNISPKLLGICRRYIKDVATAEDIVQDSFIVAIQKENTLKDASAVNGWLSRIVINMAIHHLKETKKINFTTSDDYDLVDNSGIMNRLELDKKSALLASDIDRSDILEAIDSLPEHHKSVFNMYVIDQFSHNEIAQTLAISVGTSKSNLSRARKAIQVYLFDKLNNKTVDKQKKRRVAFLLFFGLENRMFAQFYQSKFKDFEILINKPFTLAPKNIVTPNQFIGLSEMVAVSKIAFFSFGLITLLGVGFYLLSSSSNISKSTDKQNVILIESNQDNNTNQSITTKKILKTKVNSQQKVYENDLPIKTISTKKEDNVIQNPIAGKSQKTIVEANNDITKAEKPKVIVIKKQIIKRDTIYVTK